MATKCLMCGGEGWIWVFEGEMVPDPTDPTGQTPMEQQISRRKMCHVCMGENLREDNKKDDKS